MSIENSNILSKWRNLRRSERISLLEEYEYSMMEFDKMDDRQRKKFKKLVFKNMEISNKADWSIICDLKKIDESLIAKGVR